MNRRLSASSRASSGVVFAISERISHLFHLSSSELSLANNLRLWYDRSPVEPGGGAVVESSTVVRDTSLRNGKLQLRPEARTDQAGQVLDPAALDLVARLHARLEPE